MPPRRSAVLMQVVLDVTQCGMSLNFFLSLSSGKDLPAWKDLSVPGRPRGIPVPLSRPPIIVNEDGLRPRFLSILELITGWIQLGLSCLCWCQLPVEEFQSWVLVLSSWLDIYISECCAEAIATHPGASCWPCLCIVGALACLQG